MAGDRGRLGHQTEGGHEVRGVHDELEGAGRQVVRQAHPAGDRGDQLGALARSDQRNHTGRDLRDGSSRVRAERLAGRRATRRDVGACGGAPGSRGSTPPSTRPPRPPPGGRGTSRPSAAHGWCGRPGCARPTRPGRAPSTGRRPGRRWRRTTPRLRRTPGRRSSTGSPSREGTTRAPRRVQGRERVTRRGGDPRSRVRPGARAWAYALGEGTWGRSWGGTSCAGSCERQWPP